MTMRGLGVCAHLPRRSQGWLYEDLLPRMSASGIGMVRTEIHWSRVEQRPGEYAIPDTDREWFDACTAAGIRVQLLLCYGNEIHADPLDPDAYGRYCGFMARELGDRVVGFELWNEPTNFQLMKLHGGSWSGQEPCPWLERYAELVKAGAAAIKAVDPTIFVTQNAGECQFVHLAQRFPEHLAQIDGQAVHPYPTRFPAETIPWGGPQTAARDGVSVADDDHRYESLFAVTQAHCRQLLGRELQLDVTELGYSTYNPWRKPGAMGGYTEPVQAAYLLRSVLLSGVAGVTNLFLYNFMDDGVDRYEQEDNFGLICHRDAGYREKPAYAALARLTDLMGPEWVHLPDAADAALSCDIKPMPVNADLWQQPVQEPFLVHAGPELHRFRTPERELAFAWRAGRAEGELQAPLAELRIPAAADITVVDLVTGASIGRVEAADGGSVVHDLPLGANPIAVSWTAG